MQTERSCPRCGEPRGHMYCPKCHGERRGEAPLPLRPQHHDAAIDLLRNYGRTER